MKKMFCPMCGSETQINDDKPFSFCTECGNKIILQKQSENFETKQVNLKASTSSELDKKLEEVAFYYKLSLDKKEFDNCNDDPTYYLKAQDLLIDLSEQYPDDYRIWWELCKPVDFMCSSSSTDINNQYRINEDYFNKALDKAELSQKRKLIDEHDKYINNKAVAIKIAERKFAEQEKIRLEKEAFEKKAYEEKCELERIKREQEAEHQKRKIEEENKKKELERIEKENQLIAQREANLAGSKPFWKALANKDYSKINNTYFEFEIENNQTIVAVFKLISNMLYLNAFRIDRNKRNVIYQEQGFAMQFNSEGFGVKFDNSLISIKGFTPPDNILRIVSDQNDTLFVNNILLKSDTNYITNIIKTAKKPLFSFVKIFG